MNGPDDMPPAVLVEYGLEQFYLALATLGNLPQGKENFFQWVHNPATGWPSFVFSIRFPSALQEKEIHKLKLAAENGNLPDTFILSDHRSGQLLNVLAHSGFVPVLSWTGMWGKAEMVKSLPMTERVQLEETCDMIEAEKFAGVVNEVLFAEKRLPPWLVASSGKQGLWFYRVYYTSQLAGTIAMHQVANLCGIYLVTVKPEFRRMGIARSATIWVLKKAMEAGCDQFILHASRMGEPVYRKVGFQPVSRIWILKLKR